MLCYRDMTFCPFYEQCEIGEECGRALTPSVIEKANKWWGGEAPIAQWTDKPECFKGIEDAL